MTREERNAYMRERYATRQEVRAAAIAASKRWNAAHMDRLIANQKKYHAKNPEAARKASRAYYERHREEILAKAKAKRRERSEARAKADGGAA